MVYMPGVVALPGPYPYGPLLSVHLWHLMKFYTCYIPGLSLTKFFPLSGFLLSVLLFTLPSQGWFLCLGHTLMALCLVSKYGIYTLKVLTHVLHNKS